jgi:ribulose-bisphosphate carboxylase small chain
MFETFSFLPPLSDAEMAKQVQYLLNNGWTPCVEFENGEHAYADGHGWSGLDSSINSGYYDNRYWVMWKLPMYGCTNPEEVIAEIKMCTKVFPDCFVRVAGFDNIKQVQCASFLAHRPSSGAACAVDQRQVQG